MKARSTAEVTFSNLTEKIVRRLRRWLPYYLVGLAALLPAVSASAQSEIDKADYFLWDTLAVLPGTPEESHPGLAGAFSGVSNDVLIVAGGANFPIAPPWRGGNKTWSDSIYVLKKADGGYTWIAAGSRLERPVAYGVSLSTPGGILCIGGTNAEGIARDVFLLTWHTGEGRVIQQALGHLPEGFEATGGAEISGQIYITGIHEEKNQLLSTPYNKLLRTSGEMEWEWLAGCPGPPRKFMSFAAQNNGSTAMLYLFGGRSETMDAPEITFLRDGYAFNTLERNWARISDLPRGLASGLTLMGAPALAYGASSIFIFGGDDGHLFRHRNILSTAMEKAGTFEKDSLEALLIKAFENHTGFGQTIYAYNTITDTFQQIGQLPENPPVTTNAVLWDDRVVLTSGEIKPGIRTPVLWVATLQKKVGSFGILNYALLVIYLVGLVMLGVYFSFRQKTTADYFKGGGRIPWWAAGLSVFGTALSAITFMAIPAKTYATDWSYLLYNFSILLVTPVIVAFFIPFFRRLEVTTAYEFLEQRFNVAVRLFGSASFILFQLGRIAIVLYLPAIALSIVSGIDIYLCIISMGLLSLVYTLIGGIEAVIWTDVIQVFVLLGGTLFALFIILFSLEGDPVALLETAAQHDKFNVLRLEASLVEPTFWVVIVGGFFANLITYSSDQAIVQRYLTTVTEGGAARTAWTNALLVIPASLLFFGVGTGLYLFYLQHPEKLDPFAEGLDGIFPWYIIHTLPDGVSGILIAGLFSAAMSTLSSSMNSAATAFTTDFYQRFKASPTSSTLLDVAKGSTLVIGLLGTLFALWMSTSDIASLWDQFTTLLGLFTGGLGGLFLLGIISRQANGRGAIVGLAGSSVIQYFVSAYTHLHLFLYAAVGLISCVVIGHLASLLIDDRSNLSGKELTVYNALFRYRKGQ